MKIYFNIDLLGNKKHTFKSDKNKDVLELIINNDTEVRHKTFGSIKILNNSEKFKTTILINDPCCYDDNEVNGVFIAKSKFIIHSDQEYKVFDNLSDNKLKSILKFENGIKIAIVPKGSIIELIGCKNPYFVLHSYGWENITDYEYELLYK